jgi:hypothetical protein
MHGLKQSFEHTGSLRLSEKRSKPPEQKCGRCNQ